MQFPAWFSYAPTLPWLLSIAVLVLIIAFWGIGAYTRLTGLRKAMRQSFIQVDLQVKQRYVAMQSFAKRLESKEADDTSKLRRIDSDHKRAVAAAEHLARDPQDFHAMQAFVAADNAFSEAMDDLIDHTDSLSDASIAASALQASDERSRIDNRVAFARQAYNQAVMQYNGALEQFPSNAIARICHFRPGYPWLSSEIPVERRLEPGSR